MDIDFPLRIGADGRVAAAVSDDKHVRDMIEIVLFTQPGERVMRADFGTGLLQQVFAGNSPELAATLQASVRAALTQWLGDLIDVRSVAVTSREALLQVEVLYALRATGDVRKETFERSST